MNALLIIAKEGFQDLELKGTRDALLAAGFSVVLASTETGPCTGKFGSTETATVEIRGVAIGKYDRIALIGGPGAAALADNQNALSLVRAIAKAGIPLGAICIAPTILAKAGVLKGKKATVWDDGQGTQAAMLRAAGAEYTGERVTVDGLLVTGNGPDAAQEFGKVFAGLKAT